MPHKDSEKRKAYLKAYRLANKEKILSRDSVYYQANKKKIKAYRDANKEKKSACMKAHYFLNKAQNKAWCRAYYRAHKMANRLLQLMAFSKFCLQEKP
jgi:leucyl aminopeptidase (aminopeptidase T)